MESDIDTLAETLWEYHHVHQKPTKADVIFVLGSHDVRVAEYAAQLFHEGLAPYLIFSGGIAHPGDLLGTNWDRPEAVILGEVAVHAGVPQANIFLETRATNTGENILYTKQLMQDRGLEADSFLLVQKPYMERRTFATFSKQWPEKTFTVTSQPIGYQEYIRGPIPRDDIINLMVGDLQRIKEYPARGFQIPQTIPDEVWEAFLALVSHGYNMHLIA